MHTDIFINHKSIELLTNDIDALFKFSGKIIETELKPYFYWNCKHSHLISAHAVQNYKCVANEVAQSCPTLCDPVNYRVHGILQAKILERVTFPFSRGSSQSRNRTQVSRIAVGFFTSWATRDRLQVNDYGGVKKKILRFFSMSLVSTLFSLFKLSTVMHSHYSHIFSI